MAFILFVAAAATQAQSDFLLSDFESGAGTNALGGYSYFFGDAGSGGNSRITTGDSINGYWDASSVGEGYGGSEHSGRFGWVFGDKHPTCGTGCTYDPEVNMVTEFFSAGDTVRNLSGATHIRFHAKANTPVKVSVLVRTANVRDYAYYRQEIEVTQNWKEFSVALLASNTFSQPSWGAHVPFELSQAQSLQWQVSKGSNAAMAGDTLLIDDLKIAGWNPPQPDGIHAAVPDRTRNRSRFVTLGFSDHLSVSLGDASVGHGGEVLIQDLRGRILAQSAYHAGQSTTEISLSGHNGLATVRMVPSR